LNSYDDTALGTRGPFHLEATVRVLQRRPGNRVDIWDQGRYLRVIETAESLALVEVENRGTIAEPDVRFAIRAGNPARAARQDLGQSLREVLGLDVDPEPFRRLAAAESTLRATADALRGMRPPRFVGLFETFANVVPFQQLSLEAGVAIVGNLVERFGKPLQYDMRRFHAFPTAQAIANARMSTLRGCGLSARKAETLHHLARAIESGELSEERVEHTATNDALEFLQNLPGIGPWSAALVLLRGFGRLDVFPPGDVGATGMLSRLAHVEPGAPLDGIIQRFGDLRGYLYFYGLAASLMKKGLIQSVTLQNSRSHSSIKCIRKDKL
jgi:DNA-3-methyladenine glycosylase II